MRLSSLRFKASELREISRWLWPAIVVIYFLKELWVLEQVGGALHHNLPIRLLGFAIGLMVVIAALVKSLPAGRPQILALLSMVMGLTLLSYGDLLHYRAFGSLPSVAQISSVEHLPRVSAAVFSLIQSRDSLLFIDLPVLVVALTIPGEAGWRSIRPAAALRLASVGVGSIVLVVVSTTCFSKPWFGKSYVAGDIGLFGYHIWEAAGVAERKLSRSSNISERDELSAARVFRQLEAEPLAPSFGLASHQNVVFIQVESLQGFALGMEIGGQKITPNMDSIASQSVTADRFFHVADRGRTSDAQLALNCSLLPGSTGVAVYDYEENEFLCLPSLLARRGYRTIAFQALERDFWNASTIEPKMGFQTSYAGPDFEADEVIGIGLSDESLLRQVGQLLHSTPEPFYAYVLTLTSHTPYDTKGISLELDLGELEGTRAGDYLHTVHYVDQAIGAFRSSLESSGLLERTVLVLVGDHDGLTRRDSNLTDLLEIAGEDEASWLVAERQVAMMMRLPRGELAGMRAAVGSQLDLAPTILSLLGIPRKDTYFLGRDLLGDSTDEPFAIFPNGSWVSASHRYLSRMATQGEARCFDLEAEVPLEDCEETSRRGAEQLEVSRSVLEGDLIRKFPRERK